MRARWPGERSCLIVDAGSVGEPFHRRGHAMPVTHEPWLVALSLFLAIQGSYVGLSLAVQVGDATGLRRRLLIAAAAISLAFAVWTMHFIGMLAERLPFP